MMAPMAQKQSLYEILGVGYDANDLDIGLAYHNRLAQLQRAVPQDQSAIALLRTAHDVLSNPARRAAYDASLVTAHEKAVAAQSAQAPDLVLDEEGEAASPRARKFIPIGIGVAIVVAIIVGIRVHHSSDSASTARAPVAEAPKPPPPPAPPQPLPAAQILASALPATGRVLSYEMSGRAVPVGLAVSLEPGAFVTTCHGIPAGSQVVVRIGEESRSAALTVTDEVLDLCRLLVTGFAAKPLAVMPEEPKAGDKVYVLGANAKGDLALTEGTVKQARPSPAGNVIEVSTPIGRSGSGGAVFDTFGRVVGLATTPHAYGAGLNIVLPAAWTAQMRSRSKQ